MWKLLCFSLISFNAFAHEGASNHEHTMTKIMVHEAWVREAPPTSKTTAAYLQLHNHTQGNVNLLKAESPQFNKVEIHNTIIENNVAKMVEIDKLEIPKDQMVELKPKGLHIMLIEAKSGVSPKTGEMVDVKLFFSNQQVEELKIPVKKDSGMMDHHDHSHHHH
jgi:copper(I)-binding protein